MTHLSLVSQGNPFQKLRTATTHRLEKMQLNRRLIYARFSEIKLEVETPEEIEKVTQNSFKLPIIKLFFPKSTLKICNRILMILRILDDFDNI